MRKILLQIALIGFCYANAQAADAPHWQILPEKSSIEWTATYGGKAVKGSFPEFTADIAFDPAHPEASHALVKVAVSKVKSDNADAVQNLPTNDWFASTQFPLATFEVSKFVAKGAAGAFEAEGTLSIRGKPVQITLPFTTTFYDDKDATPPAHYVQVNGEVPLKRLDFGVGQGDWSSTDAVADGVKVAIHLEAKQVP
jgi:polyisoprenoid-binding protein YceI